MLCDDRLRKVVVKSVFNVVELNFYMPYFLRKFFVNILIKYFFFHSYLPINKVSCSLIDKMTLTKKVFFETLPVVPTLTIQRSIPSDRCAKDSDSKRPLTSHRRDPPTNGNNLRSLRYVKMCL